MTSTGSGQALGAAAQLAKSIGKASVHTSNRSSFFIVDPLQLLGPLLGNTSRLGLGVTLGDGLRSHLALGLGIQAPAVDLPPSHHQQAGGGQGDQEAAQQRHASLVELAAPAASTGMDRKPCASGVNPGGNT